MKNRIATMIQSGVRDLFPGIFALVMATGIISIACHLLQMALLSQVFFIFNQAAFVFLWILVLARLVFYRRNLVADLISQPRGPGFLTLVAGTCVLGSQFVILDGTSRIADILWYVGLALWLLLIYTFFIVAAVKPEKSDLETGISGAWLLIIVSTQSLSVLGTLLAKRMGNWNKDVLFFTLAMYLVGCVLYLMIMTLIFYRWFFYPVKPVQMTPTYWISTGAAAISTLAGDNLILAAGQWSFIQELLPFIKGLNILLWATATFWIPFLVLLGAWRHIYKRYSLGYDPQFWSIVFPLGMYTVCTYQLAKALNIPTLIAIPRVTVYIALLAWLAAFADMLLRLGQSVKLAMSEPK